MTLIKIKDNDSFTMYRNILDDIGDSNLCSLVSISSSRKPYGVFNPELGWVSEITIDTSSKEVKVSYTKDKENALSVIGNVLRGKILMHGVCILL